MAMLWGRAVTWFAVVGVLAICAAPASLWVLAQQSASQSVGLTEEEAFELNGKIAIVFKEPVEVSVEQPGPVLRLTFVNTQFDQLTPAEQKAKAFAIARYAANNYAQARRIRGVIVQFVRQPLVPGLSDYPTTTSKYIFLRSQLR